jgi:hypothetical protein
VRWDRTPPGRRRGNPWLEWWIQGTDEIVARYDRILYGLRIAIPGMSTSSRHTRKACQKYLI